MAQTEQDRLIEQYLAGGMSAEEESDFFVQLALDREMQLELRAHRVIDSAIGKEKESVRIEHSAMRSRMAALAAVSPALNTGGARTPIDSPATGVLTSKFIASSGWIVASVLAALLTIGAFFVAPWGEDPVTDTSGNRPAPVEMPTPGVVSPEGTEQVMDGRQNAVASEPTEAVPESTSPARSTAAANDAGTMRRNRERSSERVQREGGEIDAAEEETRTDQRQSAEAERVDVRASEELEIQVRINPQNRSIDDGESED